MDLHRCMKPSIGAMSRLSCNLALLSLAECIFVIFSYITWFLLQPQEEPRRALFD